MSIQKTTKRKSEAQQQLEEEHREKTKQTMRRDVAFVCMAVVVASILSWMEVNAGAAELRGEDAAATVDADRAIIDTGYIATYKIHDFLKAHRGWNDFLAFVNTVIGVFGPGLYFVYETFWVGDYEPIFRYGAISILRSLCGWFTYLPPDNSYLPSHYDFPDIMHCLVKDCSDPTTIEAAPFVSFFSGHVATLVIAANHMYLHGEFRNIGIFFHHFNVLQIIRLLATRGHYSIDIIIGWFMAVYVSNPAGRLGRYFSRTDNLESFESRLPADATEAFERFIGVDEVREQRRLSTLMKRQDFQEALKDLAAHQPAEGEEEQEDVAEPTAKLAAEGKLTELFHNFLKDSTTKEKDS